MTNPGLPAATDRESLIGLIKGQKALMPDVLACYPSWPFALHPALEAVRSHLNEWYTSFVAIFRSETSDLMADQNEIRSRSNHQARKERELCSPRHDLVSSLFGELGQCVGGTRCMGTLPRHLNDFERITDGASSSYLTTSPSNIYRGFKGGWLTWR